MTGHWRTLMIRGWMTVAAIAVCATWIAARQPETQEQSKHELSQLSWMTGSWVMEHGDERVEEHWTTPRAGTMFGVSRTMRGDRTVFFEFIRLEQTPDGAITYHAAPKGRSPATPFRMIEMSGEQVVFENPKHDFPTRIIYRRQGEDGMAAQVEGAGGENPQRWQFKRAGH